MFGTYCGRDPLQEFGAILSRWLQRGSGGPAVFSWELNPEVARRWMGWGRVVYPMEQIDQGLSSEHCETTGFRSHR